MQLTQLNMIDEKSINHKIEEIALMLNKTKVIVAFSGGVDSSVIALLAKHYCSEVLLVMQDGSSVGIGETDYARHMAEILALPLKFIEYDEYELSENYANNPSDRCYYCKQLLHDQLEKLRIENGFDMVINGTNASDLGGHRPGFKAVKEFNSLSPLVDADLSKFEIRWIAKKYDLPVWDKPANACLASRFQTGIKITKQGLMRVAAAEDFIKTEYQIKVLRVRDHDKLARIEVGEDEIVKLNNSSTIKSITSKLLALGYDKVILDLEGYREATPNEGINYG